MASSTAATQAACTSPGSREAVQHRDWRGALRTSALGPAARSDAGSLGLRGLLSAGWRVALTTALLGLTAYLAVGLSLKSWFLFDFRGDLFNAATAILHGHNPYRVDYIAHLADVVRRTGGVNPTFAVPVYPAPVLLAAVPFGLMPMWLGGVLFIGASIAGMAWGLRLLGVRDWRCIALAIISWPALFGLWFGTLSPLLVLGAGIAWRARERTWQCAASIASLVLTKVFPWPMMAWPLIQKRWRTFGLMVLLAGGGALAAWSLIGFHSLLTYPKMLSDLSYVESRAGVSVYAAFLSFGIGRNAALILALASAGGLTAMAWRMARRPGGRANAFGLVVLAALTASPLVWVHYEVLLFVPIALLSPSLSSMWFLPVVSGLVPVPSFASHTQMLMWPAIQLVLAVALCRVPVTSDAAVRQLEPAGRPAG
jgi:hypothetical protein